VAFLLNLQCLSLSIQRATPMIHRAVDQGRMAARSHTPTTAVLVQHETAQESRYSPCDCQVLENLDFGRDRVQLAPGMASRPCSINSNLLSENWSPVTESNRRPSPYHACRFRLATSRWIVLRHVSAIVLSDWVRLRQPWSEGVVTWFVTDCTHSKVEQGHGGPGRRRPGSWRSAVP
jgi:hypothetical protein